MTEINAYGIDFSHFQALTDAKAVRGNNITFAWGKATEGATLVDPKFAGYAAALRAAGVVTGGYHFAHAGSAAAQAGFFRKHAAAYLTPGSLWPMLDMEATDLHAALAAAHLEGQGITAEHPPAGPVTRLAQALHTTRDLAESIDDWHGATREQRDEWKRQAAELRPASALMPIEDVERYSALAEAVSASANAFVVDFFDALGVYGMVVYANLSWWETILRPAGWGKRRTVGAIARYNGDPGNPGYTPSWMGVHQHSNAGHVSGISTVDRDVIFNGHTLAELTLPGASAPTSPEVDVNLTDKLPPIKMIDGKEYTMTVGDVLWGLTQQIPGNGTPGPGQTAHAEGQYVPRILQTDDIMAALKVQGTQLAALTQAVADLAAAVKAIPSAAPAAPGAGVTEAQARAIADEEIAGSHVVPPAAA